MSPQHIALQQQECLFLAPRSAEFLGPSRMWVSSTRLHTSSGLQVYSKARVSLSAFGSAAKNTKGLLRAPNCHMCSFPTGHTQQQWGRNCTPLPPVESEVTWQRVWMNNSNSGITWRTGNNDSIFHGYPSLFESSVSSQATHNSQLHREAFLVTGCSSVKTYTLNAWDRSH